MGLLSGSVKAGSIFTAGYSESIRITIILRAENVNKGRILLPLFDCTLCFHGVIGKGGQHHPLMLGIQDMSQNHMWALRRTQSPSWQHPCLCPTRRIQTMPFAIRKSIRSVTISDLFLHPSVSSTHLTNVNLLTQMGNPSRHLMTAFHAVVESHFICSSAEF